ncbi:MAG: hypothetical protein IKR85_06985 [Clostridia bacterium]|nr:hypothetical protein [Clostridia bacterium]
MSESDESILHISGTMTEKDYLAAVRARNGRYFLRYMVIYVLLMLIFVLGLSLYEVFPYLKSGEITLSEWLIELWNALLSRTTPFVTIIGLLILYAVVLLLVRPAQLAKRMRELYPTGMPLVYDFYVDRLVLNSSSHSGDQTVRLLYSDVQRRIKEHKYTITLSTGQKNRYSLFKSIMTPEEVAVVRDLLKTHCPQHKH